jgi:hypothetical protein
MKSLLPLLALITPLLAQSPALPFGSGTITRDSQGKAIITQAHGKSTITRFSDGRTYLTTPHGPQPTKLPTTTRPVPSSKPIVTRQQQNNRRTK